MLYMYSTVGMCIYIYIAMSRMARHCKCDWIILNSLCGGMSYDTQQCMCNNGSTRFQDQLVPQVSTLLSLKDSLTNRSNLSPQRPALLGNRGTSNDHLQSSSIPLNPEEVTSASDWGWLWWNSRGLWPSLDRSGLLVLLRTCNPSSPAGPQVPGLWHPDACNHSVDNYPFWSFIFQLLVDSYPNLSQAITLCDYLCLMIDIPLFDSRSSTHAVDFEVPFSLANFKSYAQLISLSLHLQSTFGAQSPHSQFKSTFIVMNSSLSVACSHDIPLQWIHFV